MDTKLFYIEKLYPGVRFGKISRIYHLPQGNKGKGLNNFQTAFVSMKVGINQ